MTSVDGSKTWLAKGWENASIFDATGHKQYKSSLSRSMFMEITPYSQRDCCYIIADLYMYIAHLGQNLSSMYV